MKPLRFVVIGFVLVVLDLPASADLLPDPAGWGLVLFGLSPLVKRHDAFVVPRNVAVVGLVVSLPLVFVRIAPLPDLMLASVLEVALFFPLCSALASVVTDEAAVKVFTTARWFDLGLAGSAILLLPLGQGGIAVILLLTDLGVRLWASVWAWRMARTPELSGT